MSRLPRAAAWAPEQLLRSPLVWPLRPLVDQLTAAPAWPSVAEIDALLAPTAGVRFEAQRPGASLGYDASIVERGVVPTRERSAHDLWNALVWCAFPRSKRLVHELQHAARRARPTPVRTRPEDGLALVDEGAVVLLCATAGDAREVRAALDRRAPDDLETVVARGGALGVVFGHAVYEHLASAAPVVRATACVAVTPGDVSPTTPAELCAFADAALSRLLVEERMFEHPADLRSAPAETRLLGEPGAFLAARAGSSHPAKALASAPQPILTPASSPRPCPSQP